MRDLIGLWLVMQLIIIGLAGRDVYNQISAHTFDCEKQRTAAPLPVWILAFPLAFFVTLDYSIDRYCDAQGRSK